MDFKGLMLLSMQAVCRIQEGRFYEDQNKNPQTKIQKGTEGPGPEEDQVNQEKILYNSAN